MNFSAVEGTGDHESVAGEMRQPGLEDFIEENMIKDHRYPNTGGWYRERRLGEGGKGIAWKWVLVDAQMNVLDVRSTS
jgi:hypothetical protein